MKTGRVIWPSVTCMRILANAYYRLPICSGCQEHWCGPGIECCLRMGWLGSHYTLTKTGRDVLKRRCHDAEYVMNKRQRDKLLEKKDEV